MPELREAVVDLGVHDPSTAVAIAYIHNLSIDYSFFHSFLQLLGYDAEHEARVWRGGFIAFRGGTGDLAAARNMAIDAFLADDRADWLFWCDTDMGFNADTVDRLFEVADPVERPVVGALCFAQREQDKDGMGGFRPVAWPVVMNWNHVEGRSGFDIQWDYPKDSVVQCDGVGSACVLIHRSVFLRVQQHYSDLLRAQNRRDGIPEETGLPWNSWYSRVINPSTGELVGEDLSFCMRMLAMQPRVPVWVNTAVQTTHRKNIWLGQEDYWRQRMLNGPVEKVEDVAPSERLAPRYAVLATHNRPTHLLALVSSLSTQVDHIIVLDNASEPPVDEELLAKAADPASLTVITDREQPPHLSKFWNVLFDFAQLDADEFEHDTFDVAVLNDDAIVPAGWLDLCSKALREHDTAVVAHTGTAPVHRLELVDSVDYPREKRMCPWAFVMKGEAGLRADESMRWWAFDDDFNRQAAQAGGVLAVPGPLVINAQANSTTTGVLAEQAQKDLDPAQVLRRPR